MSHCKRFLHRNHEARLCGTCTAKHPFTACTGVASCCVSTTKGPYCTNENTNVNNCGACFKVCTGKVPACCSGKCADLSTTANCGKCGNVCTSKQKCIATTKSGVTTYGCG